MDWEPPARPAEAAESRLINAILEGRYPIDSSLPPERELADLLGVTRPTLREALQRLARDGWLDISQGRSTRVRDYWHEGSLGVLAAMARHPEALPAEVVPNLLAVRLALAPAYARLAAERAPQAVAELLRTLVTLPDEAQAFARGDWTLHYTLSLASGNPLFTMILNGFLDLYSAMALRYFAPPHNRAHSRAFYTALLHAFEGGNPKTCETLTREAMHQSIDLWRAASTDLPGGAP
jgi:GntR family negative regulator for fad regulon and positive regulator of fabA